MILLRLLLVYSLIFQQVASGPGVIKNGLSTKATVGDHGLSFNGTSDSTNSTAAVTRNSTDNRTSWSFWLWQNAFDNADELLAESSSNFNTNDGGFLIDPNSGAFTGLFQFSARKLGTGYNDCTFARPSSGTWHHYLLTMDMSGASTLCTAYVDGTSQTVTVQNSHPGGFTSYTVYLMSRNAASLRNAGRLSEFAIYNNILTSGDATTLSGGAPANSGSLSASPIAYVHLCSNSSPQSDVVSASWNWTITGTTIVAGPPNVTNC